MLVTVLTTLMFSLFAQAQVPQQELPEDFPSLRFNMNPLYYSVGVQLGHVLSVRRERPILSTYEGELMLGFGTGPQRVTDRICVQTIAASAGRSANQQEQDAALKRGQQECGLFHNPWRFSFLPTPIYDKLVPIKDQPVLIHYINYFVAPAQLLMRTRNQVLAVFPTMPNLKIDSSYQISTMRGVLPEAGHITGRIVKASLEYPLRKTYEVVIQESQNANNFRAMSVSDGELFNYIMRAMLTGKLLRVEFVRLYRPHASFLSTLFNYMTNFRVISVEILDSPARTGDN